MGYQLLDQYSLLHFSVGIIMYFWNINFWTAIILHSIFEIVENTKIGMYVINEIFSEDAIISWPGGKNYPDSYINMFGDTIAFGFGWWIASFIDNYGETSGWYKKHIK